MAACLYFFLDFLLTFVLWGYWSHCVRGDCGQIRRIKFDQPDNGHYLEGHVFLNLSISTKRQCEEQCLMQQECVSVNIGPPVNEKFFCELSDSDHVQHSRDLKRRCNWTYRGIENLCSTEPCLNNAKCLVGFTDKGYLCVCESGYTGENCEQDVSSCDTPVDIVFLMDSSASVSGTNYDRLKAFINAVAKSFGISKTRSRAALVLFSSSASVKIRFTDHSSTADFQEAVDRIPHERGYTRIDKALEVAANYVVPAARPYVHQIAMVITDGKQTQALDAKDLKVASEPFRKAGVQVLALGIGSSVEPDELRLMVEKDEDVLLAKNFELLLDGSSFIESICDLAASHQVQDIDACSNNTHDCHKYANCTNTAGNYNCSCRAGYTGDGRLCSAKSCSDLKRLDPTAESGSYLIDPDGEGGLQPFNVTCDMTDRIGVGVTVISHDSETRTLVKGYEAPGSYSRDIHYTGASLSQLANLARVSLHCEQFIKYECFSSRLLRHDTAWWVTRDSVGMTYWGGAYAGGKCACKMTNSCATLGDGCNCDTNDAVWREDSGNLTDKALLPVKQLRFGDTGDNSEKGYHTLGKLRCYGIE